MTCPNCECEMEQSDNEERLWICPDCGYSELR